MRDEEEKMAIEYGAFIVDGLNVKKQTLSLAGQSIAFGALELSMSGHCGDGAYR